MAVAGARPKTFPQALIEQHAARTEISPWAFSLVRYAPAAVLIAVLLADSNRHTDPDLWGHLRFGQAFIAGRHLLHRDTYSYSAAGHRWRDHEWLAEVVMAFVYNAAGVAGLEVVEVRLHRGGAAVCRRHRGGQAGRWTGSGSDHLRGIAPDHLRLD